MSIVQLMIERGADDWNGGMNSATKDGHISIVQLMIERGAEDWNGGLYFAARGGHMPAVLLMIKLGADKWSSDAVHLLESHPFEVIYLSRCGHVAQHLFALHSSLFVQWIREDHQNRATAYYLLLSSPPSSSASSLHADDSIVFITLLPRELCELVLSY